VGSVLHHAGGTLNVLHLVDKYAAILDRLMRDQVSPEHVRIAQGGRRNTAWLTLAIARAARRQGGRRKRSPWIDPVFLSKPIAGLERFPAVDGLIPEGKSPPKASVGWVDVGRSRSATSTLAAAAGG
jgi:hypothetical protein